MSSASCSFQNANDITTSFLRLLIWLPADCQLFRQLGRLCAFLSPCAIRLLISAFRLPEGKAALWCPSNLRCDNPLCFHNRRLVSIILKEFVVFGHRPVDDSDHILFLGGLGLTFNQPDLLPYRALVEQVGGGGFLAVCNDTPVTF